MILIDAVFINNSGGKVLLDYLIENLERTDQNFFYLLDDRVTGNHPIIKSSNTLQYIKGSLIKRHLFYLMHRRTFTTIFCFGNLPPTIRLDSRVLTYFHQLLFLNPSAVQGALPQLIFRVKAFIFRKLRDKTDVWLVQSENVRSELCGSMRKLKKEAILVVPFYPPVLKSGSVIREKEGFVYVSNGDAYKNHERLLGAFTRFYDRHRVGHLHVTISPRFQFLRSIISRLQTAGYPITNHGFVDRSSLGNIYSRAEYTIYPSLAESFGLGIVEALSNGCKIIGADLPYMHAVCQPSVTFDPENEGDILTAMEKAVFEGCPESRQLIFDEIKLLISILIKESTHDK